MSVCEESVHEAVKADESRMQRECTFVGVQDYGEGYPLLHLFNHVCGSTLAVAVKR